MENKLHIHNDHDLKEEIRQGAQLLCLSYEDAVELFLTSPANFRRLVAEEKRHLLGQDIWRNK